MTINDLERISGQYSLTESEKEIFFQKALRVHTSDELNATPDNIKAAINHLTRLKMRRDIPYKWYLRT